MKQDGIFFQKQAFTFLKKKKSKNIFTQFYMPFDLKINKMTLFVADF